MVKVKIVIKYCVPCGHLPKVIELTRAILNSLGQELNKNIEYSIIPWDEGVFEVWINNEIVFSRKDEKRFPEPDEIVQAVKNRCA